MHVSRPSLSQAIFSFYPKVGVASTRSRVYAFQSFQGRAAHLLALAVSAGLLKGSHAQPRLAKVSTDLGLRRAGREEAGERAPGPRGARGSKWSSRLIIRPLCAAASARSGWRGGVWSPARRVAVAPAQARNEPRPRASEGSALLCSADRLTRVQPVLYTFGWRCFRQWVGSAAFEAARHPRAAPRYSTHHLAATHRGSADPLRSRAAWQLFKV